jgi:hypothetical protein
MRKVTLPVLQSIVDDGKTSGRLWYAAAERDILTVCESEPWSQSSVCDCLALFSPRVSVRRSIRLTFRYLYDGSFFPSTFRAVRQSVLHWERTGIIRGKKTSAFSSALAGHQTAVVLDVHMANIFNVPQQKLFRQDVYASILGKLCKLSERNGLSLRDVQAALWCGWKLRQNQTVEPFPILDEYALWQRLNRQYPDVGPIA